MKVLVVDDESIVRRALRRALEMRGHEVIEASDGEAGLEKWKEVDPDLVYLDVLMPKLTGPQVLESFGPRRRSKVVLISAFTGEYNLARAKDVGADLFLAKPFSDIFAVVTAGEELCRE